MKNLTNVKSNKQVKRSIDKISNNVPITYM